jgi:release factor glutamine methyltransferase
MPTLREIYKYAKTELNPIAQNNIHLECELLIAFAIGIERYQIALHRDKMLTKFETDTIRELIALRKKLMPIAYILGKQEFYGIDFIVNQSVLIPRQDTEVLVEATLKYFDRNSKINILDLGTGSGALAITLLTLYKNATATLVDISIDALEIAMRNAVKNNVYSRGIFKLSNWFNDLKPMQFDLIISNPPYIGKEEKGVSEGVVLHEPHLALYCDVHGNQSYIDILKSAPKFLAPNGKVILEIGVDKLHVITEIALHNGFEVIDVINDLANIPRCIVLTHRVNASK